MNVCFHLVAKYENSTLGQLEADYFKLLVDSDSFCPSVLLSSLHGLQTIWFD